MLPVRSKYKIAKRLGNAVFEQTQTQKFALSEARSRKPRGRAPSDYGRQLIEKQRVRYTYGLSERQLSNYVFEATKDADPSAALHRSLEMRADNVMYRAGLASTRRASRQGVSHGHVTVNGQRITTPSMVLRVGDKIAIREGNRTSPLYAGLAEAEKRAAASWLSVDYALLTAEVVGLPTYSAAEAGLDYSTVFEFYSR